MPNDGIFRIEMNDAAHSGGILLSWLGKGIGGEYRSEVALLASRGCDPGKIRTKLWTKYTYAPHTDTEKCSRIPSVVKIQDYGGPPGTLVPSNVTASMSSCPSTLCGIRANTFLYLC